MKSSLHSFHTSTMPIIRIAPVCNGKIYVTPHSPVDGRLLMDLPMEDRVERVSTQSNKAARKVKEKYHPHIHSTMQPRFSVKYRSAVPNGETIYLYILPLTHESEINFHQGKFVSADEILSEAHLYSENLQKERALLGMAADLWEEYFEE